MPVERVPEHRHPARPPPITSPGPQDPMAPGTHPWCEDDTAPVKFPPSQGGLPATRANASAITAHRPKRECSPCPTSSDNGASSARSAFLNPGTGLEDSDDPDFKATISSILDQGLYSALKEQKQENERLQQENEPLQKGNVRLQTENERLQKELQRSKSLAGQAQYFRQRVSETNLMLNAKDSQIEALKQEVQNLQSVAAQSISQSELKLRDDRIALLERELSDAVIFRSKIEKKIELMEAEIKAMNAHFGKQEGSLQAKQGEITTLTNQLMFEATLKVREEQMKALAAQSDKAGAAAVVAEFAWKRKESGTSTNGSEGEIMDVPGLPPAKKQETSNAESEAERQRLYRKLLEEYEAAKKNAAPPTPTSTQQ